MDEIDAVLEEAEHYLLSSSAELGTKKREVLERCICILNRGVFHSPLDWRLYSLRAEAYEKLQEVEAAIKDLRYVMVRNQEVSIKRRLGRLLFIKGKYHSTRHKEREQAVLCFEEATRLDPKCPDYYVHCALNYIQLNDLNKAIHSLSQALKKAEKQAEIFIVRARIFWILDARDASIADMRSAAGLAPDHPEVIEFSAQTIRRAAKHYTRGMDAMRTREYSRAIEAFNSSYEFTPDDFKVVVSRAAAYRLSGNLQQALIDLDLASCLFSGKDIKRSHEEDTSSSSTQTSASSSLAFKEPFQLVRQRSLVWNELALQYMQKNDRLSEALDLLHKVIEAECALVQRGLGENKSIDFRFYVNRGDCYQALNRPSQALEDYRRAFDSNPSEESVCARLAMHKYHSGIAYFNDSNYFEAVDDFSQAIKLNPRIATYYQARGLAFYYQFKFNEARDDLQEALRLDPTLTEVRQRLEQFNASTSAASCNTQVESASPSVTTSSPPKYLAQIPRGFRAVVTSRKATLPKIKPDSRPVPAHLVAAAHRRKRVCDKLSAIRRHSQYY